MQPLNTLMISDFQYKTLIKHLELKNVLYFLFFLPMSFTKDLGISVLELRDIFVILIILLWFSRRKRKKLFHKTMTKFSPVFRAFTLFMFWCSISICLSFFSLNSSTGVLMMFARQGKVILYSFCCYIFVSESFYENKSHVFMLYGLAFGYAAHFLIPLFLADGNLTLVHTNWGYKYEGMNFGETAWKNTTANFAALLLIFLFSNVVLSKSRSLVVLAAPVILLLYFLNSRSSWLVFTCGLFICICSYFFSLTSSVKKKAISQYSKYYLFLLFLFLFLIAYGIYSPVIKENLFVRGLGIKENVTSVKGSQYIGLESRKSLPLQALQTISKKAYIIGEGYYSRFYSENVWRYGSHNSYVQFIWEIGIIGLLLFLNIFYRFWELSFSIPNIFVRNLLRVQIVMTMISALSGEFYSVADFFAFQFIFIFSFFILYRYNDFPIKQKKTW